VLILEEGNPNLGGGALPKSWTNDGEIMEIMTTMNWLADETHASKDFAAFDLPDSPNDNLGMMFEYLLDRRKGDAIGAFSIGPTQMYLRFSPLAEGGTSLPSRFSTWEDLWQFYTAEDLASQWEAGNPWSYLGTGLNTSLQVCGNAGAGCIERWLQMFQTGVRPWEETTWNNYAQRFKNNINLMNSIGLSVGYPGAGSI
jgi:hypothetical protein